MNTLMAYTAYYHNGMPPAMWAAIAGGAVFGGIAGFCSKRQEIRLIAAEIEAYEIDREVTNG